MTNTNLAVKTDQQPWFIPSNLQQALSIAKSIANSDLAPKDYKGKESNVLIAIMMGQGLGLSPLQSIQGIAVINGKPLLWGDALLGIIQAHPEYAGKDELSSDDGASCTLRRRRNGFVETVTNEFSKEDAKAAGLLNKDLYKNYPKRMFLWRARTFSCRDLFADVLKGLSTVEEYQHEIDITPVVPTHTTKQEHIAAKLGTTLAKPDPIVSDDLGLDPDENVDPETGEILETETTSPDSEFSPISAAVIEKARIIEEMMTPKYLHDYRQRLLDNKKLSSFEEFSEEALDWCIVNVQDFINKKQGGFE